MSNYHVEPVHESKALTKEALKAVRHEQVQGVSRRELLRGSLAAGMGLWLLEVTAGTVGFLWPNLEGKFGGEVVVGTLADIKTANSTLPIDQGFPAYCRVGQGVRDPHRPEPAAVHPGRGPGGRRHVGQRPRAVPALPAPRLQAEPVPQELLDGVPLPRVALRPAGHQGRGPAVRPRAARHGPLRRARSTRAASSRSTPARSRSDPCRSPSASPGSSRRARPPAASSPAVTRPHRGDR